MKLIKILSDIDDSYDKDIILFSKTYIEIINNIDQYVDENNDLKIHSIKNVLKDLKKTIP